MRRRPMIAKVGLYSFLAAASLALGLGFPFPACATDTQSAGGGGGEPFRILCPAGHYLGGLFGWSGDYVDKLYISCRRWTNWGGAGYDVPQWGHSAGQSGGGTQKGAYCPSGYLVIGATWDTLSSDNQLLEQFSLRCAPVDPQESGMPRWLVYFEPHLPSRGERGGSSFGGRTQVFCPAGEWAVGIYGRSGLFVGRIGLVCGKSPPIIYRPFLVALAAGALAVAIARLRRV